MSSRRSNLQSFRVNKDSTNAGLWLDKFIVRQDDVLVNYSEKQAKQTLVDEISQIKVPLIYEHFYNETWLKSFEKVEKKFIEISGRMIIGLGAESVLETSITLHRTYGVPYIPGSALKGLAASFAHRFMGEDWKKEPKDKATKETKKIGEAHRLMFGLQESAGYVIFHDALYVPNSYGKNPLATDILTVHHSEYYKDGKSAPADWDNPIPIPLLSAQGRYLLVVSANSGDAKFDEKMTSLAIEILGLALEQEGIGAKTSSGYGRASVKDYSENLSVVSSSKTVTEEIVQKPTQEPKITEAEKQAKLEQRNQNIFKNIEGKLLEISDYKKESRKKFKMIVSDDLSRLNGEVKNKAAKLIVETVRIISQKDDGLLEGAAWFVEAKKWM